MSKMQARREDADETQDEQDVSVTSALKIRDTYVHMYATDTRIRLYLRMQM